MKKWLVLGVFVLISSMLFAQRNGQDVVYLRNGSVIRGNIIEEVPNQSIKIATADGSVFVCQMDEIEKITKEQRVVNRGVHSARNNGGSRFKPMNKIILESGYLRGLMGANDLDRVKLDVIVGRQLSPHFLLGFGTGLRYYDEDFEIDGWWHKTETEETLLVPLFFDIRVNFTRRKISPYFAFDIGYSYDTNAANAVQWAGFMASHTLGAKIKLSDRLDLNVGLEYEAQGRKYRYKYKAERLGPNGYYYDYEMYRASKTSGALGVSVGISF
jgi:hypothetical protein